MGKGTDKLYITASEWSSSDFGSGGGAKFKAQRADAFRCLPFSHCALSLVPFTHPVCTPDGMIFDLMHIVPWLKKHHCNPVTGEGPLEPKALIRLEFHRNAEGDYCCPITYKVFNPHSHIVAIRSSGHVYAYDAVERLNIQAKYWKDLMTDDPFTRKDIITLQDPQNVAARNISEFYYKRAKLMPVGAVGSEDVSGVKSTSSTKVILEKLKEAVVPAQSKPATESGIKKSMESFILSKTGLKSSITPSFIDQVAPHNQAHFSTGAAASSFTSTSQTPVTVNAPVVYDDEEFMFARIKEKGLVAIDTTHGTMELELYCPYAPRTCYNFITLAKRGSYDDTSFHRNIPGFMIQGGDPTGTGKGGDSCWGKPFPDEIKPHLTHDAPGVLSMANKGKDTNTSQFFITYSPASHLNRKHTVFGKLTRGNEVLAKLENVPVDNHDKPLQPILIKSIRVLIDPFEEFKLSLDKKLHPERHIIQKRVKVTVHTKPIPTGSGVGKYMASTKVSTDTAIQPSASPWDSITSSSSSTVSSKKRKGSGFGDFSNW